MKEYEEILLNQESSWKEICEAELSLVREIGAVIDSPKFRDWNHH
jgi:hypothetical protein